jgi:hypothetical protein
MMGFRHAVAWLMVVGGLAAASVATRADEFVPGVEDLPLMPGMTLEGGGAELSFDTPGGRIVDVVVQARTDWPQIRAFYTETLAQLGWTPAPQAGEALSFDRDSEHLLIEQLPAVQSDVVSVRFSLLPD